MDQIIRWLTGYTPTALQKHFQQETTFGEFFATASFMNPNASLIKGMVCGVHVEKVEDPSSAWLVQAVVETYRPHRAD